MEQSRAGIKVCTRARHACFIRFPPASAGDVWHVAVDGLPAQGVLYGYKLAGPGSRFKPHTVMLDPYAPLVEGRKEFGKRDAIEDFKPTVRLHRDAGPTKSCRTLELWS